MRWFLRPARACVVAAALLAGGAVAGCDKGDAPRVEVEPGVAAGDVREVAGAVAAIRGDARRILAVGDEVSGDDVIETGADGQVVIELRHNGARWSLGPSQSRRVAESAAWNAPRQAGGAGGAGERTAAAGREGEREGADTAASAVAPAAAPVPVAAAAVEPGAPEALKQTETAEPTPAEDPATRSPTPPPPPPPPPEKKPVDHRHSRGGSGTGDSGGGPDVEADDREGCDEVACLLDDSAPCCRKMRKKAQAERSPASSDLPDSLDPAAVRAGIDPVKADVAACGKGARGRVKLSIKVSPAGKVTSVSVVEAPDGDVGACAAKAVSTATFARTRSGGSFVFPFLL